MMEITAEIRALIDKAAGNWLGRVYIDPADGLIHCKSAAARGRPLCHALGNPATSCRAVCQCQRPRNSARPPRNGTHGAHQSPEGPGPARPLSVRLHLCQRRPKSSDGQGPRVETGRRHTGTTPACFCLGMWELASPFRQLYRQRPA